MKLSYDQENAVAEILRFLRGPDRVFRLSGVAGSGKSTVISAALSDRHDVRYSAPTAKAAMVLRDKGTEAVTLHSLMFQPVEVEDRITGKPKLVFKENPRSVLWDGGVLVVDEASMVPAWMAERLVEYPIKIIAVGDPFQLPPVRSSGSMLTGPGDAVLTQVHRTALDSPVLELATHIREHGGLPSNFSRGRSKVVTNTSEAGDLTRYDQILVGKHATRFRTNNYLRRQLGRKTLMPEVGERVLAKRNDLERGIVNGAQYQVKKVLASVDDFLYTELIDSQGMHIDVTAWKYGFTGPKGLEKLESMSFKKRAENIELWHSEAVTTHSAQGSEWDDVLVVDESSTFRNNASRWLYTAVTRARESVTVIRR